MKDQKSQAQKEYEFKFYEECCKSYHRIDDFRAKLLGFLPLASGAGIFLSLQKNGGKDFEEHLLPIGIFGFVVTLGLLFYELRGVQRCIRLANLGRLIEEKHGILGQFSGWPHSVLRFINEPIAAGFIYSVVLGAWSYIAFHPDKMEWIAVIVFILSFLGVWGFYLKVRGNKDFGKDVATIEE